MAAQDVRYYLNGLLLLIDETASCVLWLPMVTGLPTPVWAAEQLADWSQELILPRKTVFELGRFLADSDEPLEIELAPNQIRFQFGHISLVSKLIGRQFPDYERVIPATLKNIVVVNRATLLQPMVRAAILTNEKFRGVRLVLGVAVSRSWLLTPSRKKRRKNSKSIMPAMPSRTLVNVSYLLDVLNNTSAEAIEWGFNDANSSALISILVMTAFGMWRDADAYLA